MFKPVIFFDLDCLGISSPSAIYVGKCKFIRSEVVAGVPVYKIDGGLQSLSRHCFFAKNGIVTRFLKQFYLTVDGKTLFLFAENTFWHTAVNFLREASKPG